jgi:hypothetical protein
MFHSHRATDDCRFMLLCMVEMRRLMLPTPDLRFPASSLLLGDAGGELDLLEKVVAL